MMQAVSGHADADMIACQRIDHEAARALPATLLTTLLAHFHTAQDVLLYPQWPLHSAIITKRQAKPSLILSLSWW